MKKIVCLICIVFSVNLMAETHKEYYTMTLQNVTIDGTQDYSSDNCSNIINREYTLGLNENVFKDSLISISFKLHLTHIDFTLACNINKNIKIDWNNALIVVNRSNHQVIHSGIVYKDRFEEQSPTTILRGMEYSDFIAPADYVNLHDSWGWWFRKLFLKADGDNQPIYVMLPIIIDGKSTEYVFNFLANYHVGKIKVDIIDSWRAEYVTLK